MKLVGCIPARNESWVLRATIPAALKWLDAVVILDHCSTDDTPDVIGWLALQYPGRVHRLHESDPTWRESAYRQRLMMKAGELGATHVATIDADEALTANAAGLIRDEIDRLRLDEVLCVPWFMLWGSLKEYRNGDRSVWSSAVAPFAFCLSGRAYAGAAYDIHQRVPAGLAREDIWTERDKGLMHFQHVSRRRLVAKQLLYKLTEVLRWGNMACEIEAKYGRTTDESGMKLSPVPDAWGVPVIDADAEPWQEAEVKRLLREHGRERFAGIDLLGL